MKILAWISLGLGGGIIVAWVFGVFGNGDQIAENGFVASKPKATSDLELRVAMLETQLAEEVELRQNLEATLDNLMLDQWSTIPVEENNSRVNNEDDESNKTLTPEQRREQFFSRQQERQADRLVRRTQRLEDAGFSPEQTAWILQREEELRLEQLNQQWEQRRQRYLENAENNLAGNKLREELGEAGYERYLEATGRSSSVYVSQLVNNSPAKAAGFQPGDEIVRYNGQRVYDFNDLNLANVQGELGEAVVIDIIRDGVPMQLVVDRGPLGIVGGRRRGFRDR